MSLLSDPLKAFIQVSEQGTVLGAASVLGITQTAVTQRIRSIEKSLGVTLFLRSRKGMLKTKEGEELYTYCKNVLRLESESLSFQKDIALNRNVQISICGSTSIIRSNIVPQLRKLMKSYPQLHVNIQIDDFEDRIKKLKSGQIDFACIRSQDVPNEIEGKPLTPNRFVLVGPSIWNKRAIKDIVRSERIIDFGPSDDMAFLYLKKFKLIDLVRNDRNSVNNIESLIDLIDDGHGYGILEEKFLELFVDKRKIAILNGSNYIENKMALCWMPRPVYSKLFTEIIKTF